MIARLVMVLVGAAFLAVNVAFGLHALWSHNEWATGAHAVGALFSLLCVKQGVGA